MTREKLRAPVAAKIATVLANRVAVYVDTDTLFLAADAVLAIIPDQDAQFNEGIEAAAKRVKAMEFESCFPFCGHTIDGAAKRIRALRKES